MAAGKRDRRISISQNGVAKDDYGQITDDWSVIATVWAKFEPVSDRESYVAGQVKAGTLCRFTILYSSDVAAVNAKDRITFDGSVYEIIGVKEIGRREELEITASTRAD